MNKKRWRNVLMEIVIIMKKLFLCVAVVAAMCASCASTSEKADHMANDFKSMIDTCTNSDSMKVYIERAVAYARQLEKDGKGDEARMYLNDIQSTVATKDPSMATYFDAAKKGIDLKVVADSLADVAKEKATDAADSLKTAAAETAGNIKDAVTDKAKEVTGKAKEAVSGAADKAGAAASAAAQSAKDKASEALNSLKK